MAHKNTSVLTPPQNHVVNAATFWCSRSEPETKSGDSTICSVTASIEGVIERWLCDLIPGSIREWSTPPPDLKAAASVADSAGWQPIYGLTWSTSSPRDVKRDAPNIGGRRSRTSTARDPAMTFDCFSRVSYQDLQTGLDRVS
jgi:hypothetical protein